MARSSPILVSLAWPDPIRPGAYRLEIIIFDYSYTVQLRDSATVILVSIRMKDLVIDCRGATQGWYISQYIHIRPEFGTEGRV